MIRVVIADDHRLVTQGISALLENDREIKVVGKAADGREAVQLTQRHEPDIVLMDVKMPRMNGTEALEKIQSLHLRTRVIMLSVLNDPTVARYAIKCGAKGYLVKDAAPEVLLEAIRTVQAGGIYLPPDFPKSILYDVRARGGDETFFERFEQLTAREFQILALVVRGMTNKDVGDQVHISYRTVEKHRTNIKKKLGVDDLASLVQIYMRYREIFPEN